MRLFRLVHGGQIPRRVPARDLAPDTVGSSWAGAPSKTSAIGMLSSQGKDPPACHSTFYWGTFQQWEWPAKCPIRHSSYLAT